MACGHLILRETPARPVWPVFEIAKLGALTPVARTALAKDTGLAISPVPNRNNQQQQHQGEFQDSTPQAQIVGSEPSLVEG
jgi:hypothetical protein